MERMKIVEREKKNLKSNFNQHKRSEKKKTKKTKGQFLILFLFFLLLEFYL